MPPPAYEFPATGGSGTSTWLSKIRVSAMVMSADENDAIALPLDFHAIALFEQADKAFRVVGAEYAAQTHLS